MEQPGLTPKQQAIHDWLYAFWLAHGYPPTVREVQEHFGLASGRACVMFELDEAYAEIAANRLAQKVLF